MSQGPQDTLSSEYAALVARALPTYLPDGILHELVADYPSRGGSYLRPVLCLAVARALGARLEDALPPAVALEMLHNAFLIHDDIEDGSEFRRGRPTLHAKHGIPIALNAGDALAALALRPLTQWVKHASADMAVGLFEETAAMLERTVTGQALELHWRERSQGVPSEAEYLEMVLGKTCWYTTIYPCRVGALVTGEHLSSERFVRFGFLLGAAFQIQDDVRNVASSLESYGKEIAGDLWEGKRTLQIVHLHASASAGVRAEIEEFLALSRESRTEADVRWLLEQMVRNGSIEYAAACSQGLAGAALHEFELEFRDAPASRDREYVASLCLQVLKK